MLASIWSALVWLLDGIALTIGPFRVSSSDSIRPLIVAASAGTIYIAFCGPKAAREGALRLLRALTPRRVALILTSVVVAVGIANNSWGVGGSDSYSYASQMDLWLRGELKVPVTMASEVPWPNALATFTPFGYTAVARDAAIAPVTPPGLPLLMAAFKSIGRHASAFLVVPLTGGLLVWSTFLIGRRLGSDRLALAGAWLVATSPTFLMMFKSQMSDVPARRILDGGDLLDPWNDGFERHRRGPDCIAGDSDSTEPAAARCGTRRLDGVCCATESFGGVCVRDAPWLRRGRRYQQPPVRIAPDVGIRRPVVALLA